MSDNLIVIFITIFLVLVGIITIIDLRKKEDKNNPYKKNEA